MVVVWGSLLMALLGAALLAIALNLWLSTLPSAQRPNERHDDEDEGGR